MSLRNTYTLTPLNENQELNYQETVRGRNDAETRAVAIAKGLQQLLPGGTFTCKITVGWDKSYVIAGADGKLEKFKS